MANREVSDLLTCVIISHNKHVCIMTSMLTHGNKAHTYLIINHYYTRVQRYQGFESLFMIKLNTIMAFDARAKQAELHVPHYYPDPAYCT